MIDWFAAGYHWDAWINVEVVGRPVADVARAIAELDGIHSVQVRLMYPVCTRVAGAKLIPTARP